MMCDLNIYGIGNLYVYEIANWKKASGVVFTDKKLQFGNASGAVFTEKESQFGNASGEVFTDKFMYKT